MPLGPSIDTDSTITAEAAPNTHWRIAKWNWSSKPIRAAAAGLEANDSSTPSVTSKAVAPSNQRSVVHHQTPSRERSVRAKAWVVWKFMAGGSEFRVKRVLRWRLETVWRMDSANPNSAHPGECRDPDPLAVWLIGGAQRSWRQPQSHSIWVPAFAGMSGLYLKPFWPPKPEPSPSR